MCVLVVVFHNTLCMVALRPNPFFSEDQGRARGREMGWVKARANGEAGAMERHPLEAASQ